MVISQIAAASTNNVIGLQNRLPWNMPKDMAYFKNTTWGHFIITGRKNYEAEGRALPGRKNIILTRNKNFTAADATVVHDLETAIAIAIDGDEEELFIVGGEEIYRLALPFTHRIYLTRIHAIIEGDTFYPEIDPEIWKEVSRVEHKKDTLNPYDYDFLVFERKLKLK